MTALEVDHTVLSSVSHTVNGSARTLYDYVTRALPRLERTMNLLCH